MRTVFKYYKSYIPLIVGILAFICYNILVARVEKLVFKLEARATEFMDVLNEPVA